MKFSKRFWMAFVAALAIVGSYQAVLGQDLKFDVNDVSYLWPVPTTVAEVDRLVSANELLVDGLETIWPEQAFKALLDEIPNVSVVGTTGTRTIQFEDASGFAHLENWRIAAFRVDPSAPGTSPKFKEIAGESPQLRLIVQPVIVDSAGKVRVHDVTAHLVFNYVKRPDPGSTSTDSRPSPDKEAFNAIVQDLAALKASLKGSGIETSGELGIHPGFLQTDVPDFGDRVKQLLQKHLAAGELTAMAFMGLDTPEPWIFFALVRQPDGTFVRLTHQPSGNSTAQMLSFRDSPQVLPEPVTSNLGVGKGVSTSLLFPDPSPAKLSKPVFTDADRPKLADVPDIVANPLLSAFFNTDCVSCHTESARREALEINVADGTFQFMRPAGISGVDEALLPSDEWNVRNFGWFPRRGIVSATVTLRTANEAAESAAYINDEYLSTTE